MNNNLKKNLTIASLITPGILLFFVAIFVPILLSVYYSLTDMSGATLGKLIWLENYKEIIFKDGIFWRSLMNALILAASLCFIQHPIALGFAILLDKIGGKTEKFFRTVLFIPVVISSVVICRMFVNIFDPTIGLLNKVMEVIGLGAFKQQWLGDTKLALICIIVILMWQGFGNAMIIYYSGVKGIPDEIYEAARIDGASGLRLYSKITIPLLKPIIKVNFTIAIIFALKQMEVVFLTTGGGPGDVTQFIGNYLYMMAFNANRYGYANAISVLFVIICLIATYLNNKLINTDIGEF